MASAENINEMLNKKTKFKHKKTVSIILFILAIVYLIIPVDYDGSYLGLMDDFFFFMAAFSFLISSFLKSLNKKAQLKLEFIALTFLILGVAVLLTFIFTPILRIMA